MNRVHIERRRTIGRGEQAPFDQVDLVMMVEHHLEAHAIGRMLAQQFGARRRVATQRAAERDVDFLKPPANAEQGPPRAMNASTSSIIMRSRSGSKGPSPLDASP